MAQVEGQYGGNSMQWPGREEPRARAWGWGAGSRWGLAGLSPAVWARREDTG